MSGVFEGGPLEVLARRERRVDVEGTTFVLRELCVSRYMALMAHFRRQRSPAASQAAGDAGQVSGPQAGDARQCAEQAGLLNPAAWVVASLVRGDGAPVWESLDDGLAWVKEHWGGPLVLTLFAAASWVNRFDEEEDLKKKSAPTPSGG